MSHFDKQIVFKQLDFFLSNRQQFMELVELVESLDMAVQKDYSGDALDEFYTLFNRFFGCSFNLITKF